jgi:hypothetical protein
MPGTRLTDFHLFKGLNLAIRLVITKPQILHGFPCGFDIHIHGQMTHNESPKTG